MLVIGPEEVRARLPWRVCADEVRAAMIALSAGEARQIPRQIVVLPDGSRALGVMAGTLGQGRPFGAKVLSVALGGAGKGGSHQGMVLLFDPDTGAPAGMVDAGEITARRTAAASVVASRALANPEPRVLAVLGTGEQARSHLEAFAALRPSPRTLLWGRDPDRARALAEEVAHETGRPIEVAASVREAVAEADVICTVTAAVEPILHAAEVPAGAHLNVVGSSRAGPAEIDDALVARARMFADWREAVLREGAEFLNAKAAGLVDDAHVEAEIGDVLAGAKPGRRSPEEVTLYKSLGVIVQDLATAWRVLKGE
jgi:ornithine cyclodeaminase